MKWSPQQDAALVAVDKWLKDPGDQQVYRLFGYAGTGKTTLAMHLAENAGSVMFGAFTGKAAYVLRQKGCPEASTLHSIIYKPQEKSRLALVEMETELAERIEAFNNDPDLPPDFNPEDDSHIKELRAGIAREKKNLARPAFSLNEESDLRFADLLVVDEVSMVNEPMGIDLESFGVPILVLGDPAQLPPVGGGGYFTNSAPDTMLTEIHRQALDNPIVCMATEVRHRRVLKPGKYGDSEVIAGKVDSRRSLEFNQVLVGMNRTRHATNDHIRSLLGFTEQHPITKDKLVCLRNDHDCGLLNGGIWFVEKIGDKDQFYIEMTIRPEDGEGNQLVMAHMAHFLRDTDIKHMSWWERKVAQEFDYGYALTVHKSQGSQWDNVLLMDESNVFGRHDPNAKWRWLYTGITRAAERITICT